MNCNYGANGRNNVGINVGETLEHHKLEGKEGGYGKAKYQRAVGHQQQDYKNGTMYLGLRRDEHLPLRPQLQLLHARKLLDED